jgi:hypothetical protein
MHRSPDLSNNKTSPRFYNYLVASLCLILVISRYTAGFEGVLSWDVFGYYLYLPAKFIYKDLALTDQSWIKHLMDTYQPSSTLYQVVQIENGSSVIKYSSGTAILCAPFFFIAHWLAPALGFPADGLSAPYQLAVLTGGIVWAIIGIILLSKILRRYFDLVTSSLLLLLIILGTNYFQLTAYDGTLLTSNFLFAFYALIVHFTIKWHDEPKLKYAIYLGLACGFSILIRPSEVTAVLIPALWNVQDKESWEIKLKLVRQHFSHALAAGFCMVLAFSPQLLYWKSLTGNYFFYSYVNSGEGFDFLTPYTIQFLFGFRKGWFIYTPLMLIAMSGFYYLYKKNRALFFAILIFCIVDIYVVSSWTCWWYAGGSFSSRSLVPAYTVLVFPLGYFIEALRAFRKAARYAWSALLIFLVALNLFQTWQFEKGILSKDRMTKKYYLATFGATKVKEEDKKLLLVDRGMDGMFINEQEYSKKILYENNFNKKEATDFKTDSSGVLQMNEQVPFSPGPDLTYNEITEKDHAWIRASVKVFIPGDYKDELPLLVATFNHNDVPYKYMAKELNKDSVKRDAWNELKMDYLTPEVRSKRDNLKIYIWQRGKGTVFIDDMLVLGFELLHNPVK